jgi:hypothetical protein
LPLTPATAAGIQVRAAGQLIAGTGLGIRFRFFELFACCAHCRAQAFLKGWVIVRHFQHIGERQVLLYRPGKQVRDVFAARNAHLGAQQSTRIRIGIDVQGASIAHARGPVPQSPPYR